MTTLGNESPLFQVIPRKNLATPGRDRHTRFGVSEQSTSTKPWLGRQRRLPGFMEGGVEIE
jgi:hypothetical protein